MDKTALNQANTCALWRRLRILLYLEGLNKFIISLMKLLITITDGIRKKSKHAVQFCTLEVIATVAGLPINKAKLSKPSWYTSILGHPSQRMLVSFPQTIVLGLLPMSSTKLWKTRKSEHRGRSCFWALVDVWNTSLAQGILTVKIDSSVASLGMKTYNKARIELRNLQFLKKMLEKSSPFLSSDQPSEPKSLDVALINAGVENYARKTCDCGQPGGHSIRILNGKEL